MAAPIRGKEVRFADTEHKAAHESHIIYIDPRTVQAFLRLLQTQVQRHPNCQLHVITELFEIKIDSTHLQQSNEIPQRGSVPKMDNKGCITLNSQSIKDIWGFSIAPHSIMATPEEIAKLLKEISNDLNLSAPSDSILERNLINHIYFVVGRFKDGALLVCQRNENGQPELFRLAKNKKPQLLQFINFFKDLMLIVAPQEQLTDETFLCRGQGSQDLSHLFEIIEHNTLGTAILSAKSTVAFLQKIHNFALQYPKATLNLDHNLCSLNIDAGFFRRPDFILEIHQTKNTIKLGEYDDGSELVCRMPKNSDQPQLFRTNDTACYLLDIESFRPSTLFAIEIKNKSSKKISEEI